MPHEETDYSSLDQGELRQQLNRVSTQLSSWQFALGRARADHAQTFIDGYEQSRGKSVAERRMDAEVFALRDQREIYDAEGQVGYFTVLRDMIVVLLNAG